jgi:hypothetical protein
MNMRISGTAFILAALFACASGCKGTHPRPANVPSSAVWVDNAFIDCSVESPSKGDRCTVYKDDSGRVLADGLFVLKTTHEGVDKPGLQFAAFAHGMIYLQDARILVHIAPSARDPSHRTVIERLEALAMKGSSTATDCSKVGAGKADAISSCALKAFTEHRAFYFCYYRQGSEAFDFKGIAADEAGNAYYVDYNSTEVVSPGQLMKELQTPFDSHTFVVRCPAPVDLYEGDGGWLSCTRWSME